MRADLCWNHRSIAAARILAGLALSLLAVSSAGVRAEEIFVTTTTYEVFGSTSRMTATPPWNTVLDEYTIHSDAVVRAHGAHVYVLNRLFADNVLVLDAAAGYSVVTQFSVTSTGLNPRDLEVITPDRAYVTLYEGNALLVCDPRNGATRGSIDLSGFADADGICEMDQMARVGNRVFVGVQALDRRQSPWAPTGGSRLVVIDSTTDSLVDADPSTSNDLDAIVLEAQNPYWRLDFDGRLGRLLVVAPGSFLALDGGVEIVNPFTLRSEGLWITEAQIGAEILDFVLVDDTTAWVLINDASFNTSVVRVDPSSGAVGPTLVATSGFALSDLELDHAGHLYVGDRSPATPGIRVFDARSGAALAGPIDVGLPPFDMAVVDGAATGSPAPGRPLSIEAWPNPFNPRVQIRVGGSVPELEIFDARGRRVRTLRPRVQDGPQSLFEWDGSDDTGQALSGGVYRARIPGRRTAGHPLVLVR